MEKIEIKKNKPHKVWVGWWLVLAFSLGVLAFMIYQPEKIVKVKEEVKPIEPPCYCVINEYTKEICKYEDWDKLIAVATMYAESDGNINALGHNQNGTIDFSLFQINEIWIKEFGLLSLADPIQNIKTAHTIWGKSGWGQWYAMGTDRWMDILTKLENCSFQE